MSVSQSLKVTQESQSITNNTSVIRIKWTSTQSGASYNSNTKTAYYWVSVNGGTEKKYSVSYTLPKSTTKTIVNKTLTVSHNSEGKCSVKVRTQMNTGISAGTIKKSASLTLSTIPRKSTLTVADGTLGTAQNLTITEKASAFNHKLTYSCGDVSDYILGSSSETSSILTTTWTPPLSLANQNTTGTSVPITFTLYTYSGTTLIGSNSYTNNFAIPASIKPTVPTISLSDPTELFSTYDGYVQNKSTVKVTASASGSYGSTIQSYTVYLNGNIYNGAVLTSSGTNTISVTATDSRGRSNSNSVQINVLPYSKPTISLKATKSDAHLVLSYNLTYSSLNSKNKVKVDIYGSPSLIENTTIASNSTATSNTFTISIDPDMTYNNVYAKVTDALGEYNTSTKSTIWGSERIFNVHPSGTGIGFGKKVTSENLFECKWPTQFLDSVSGPNGFGTSSDRRVKKNIENLNIDIIDKLQSVQYQLIDSKDNKIHYGFIAQDVMDALLDSGIDPEVCSIVGTVQNGKEQQYVLTYTEFVPLLVNKCQSLQSEVNQLHQEILELKNLIT